MWDENYYSCCVGSSNSSATDTVNSRTVAGSGRVFSNYLHGGALSYFCVLNWKIRILFSSLLLGYSAYYLLLFHVANRARRKTETRAAKGVSVDTLTFKFTLLQIAFENCCILSIPKLALTTGHQASMPFRMDAKKVQLWIKYLTCCQCIGKNVQQVSQQRLSYSQKNNSSHKVEKICKISRDAFLASVFVALHRF